MRNKFLAVFLCGFLAGCQSGSLNLPKNFDILSTQPQEVIPVQTTKTKTAVLLPLSGANASIGDSFRNAALMAQLERNTQDATDVVFFDTKGTPQGAMDALQKASATQPDVILGPIFSPEVATIANQHPNTPVISFTSDPTVLSENIYSMALLVPQQIDRIVAFACQKDQKRIALLGPQDKTGELVLDSFKKAVHSCPNMQITKISLYKPTETNLTPFVQKIAPPLVDARRKNLTDREKELLKNPSADRIGYDALFIFEQGVKLQQLSSLLSYYDVRPDLISFYGLATLRNQHNTDLIGAYFADLPQEKLQRFRQNYMSAFATEPIMISAFMYDSIALVSFLSQKGMLNTQALTAPDGYQGFNGRFRLNQDGTNNRLLEMFQITGKNSAVKVEAAPSSYEAVLLMQPTNETYMQPTQWYQQNNAF